MSENQKKKNQSYSTKTKLRVLSEPKLKMKQFSGPKILFSQICVQVDFIFIFIFVITHLPINICSYITKVGANISMMLHPGAWTSW